jgi:hypothetical protein
MSDTPTVGPPYKSYGLSLGGRITRHIHARGEGEEIARPGARRSIDFDDCELHGVNETENSAAHVFVEERLPDQLPWPDVPWKIGEIDLELKANGGGLSRVSFHIPPVAFQHLWDIAEAPRKQRLDMSTAGQIGRPHAVSIYDVGFEVQPRTHPIVPQLVEQLGRATDQWIRRAITGVLWGLIPVMLVLELIRWLWR